jgi:hypothetical protein
MKTIIAIAMCGLMMGVANANLVVNGSFETGPVGVFTTPSSDVMTGWRMFDTTAPDAVTYELVNDAVEATDGNNYMKITSTTQSGVDAGLDITAAGSGAFAVAIGTSYRVSFDAKRVAGTDNQLNLSIKTMEGNSNLEVLVSEGFALTSEWKTYTYTVTPTLLESGGAEPNFYVGFRPKSGAALQDETIFIDNVSVVETPNELGNASFEEGTVGLYAAADMPNQNDGLPGWRMFDTSKSWVSYELVNDPLEATDGSNYVKIISTAGGDNDAGLDIYQFAAGVNSFSITPGESYTVSFDAKVIDGTDNLLAVAVHTFDGTAALEKDLVSETITLTSDWTTYSYEISPTLFEAAGTDPNFYIAFRPRSGVLLLDETVCIDNLSVVEIPDNTSLVNGSFEEGPVGELNLTPYAVTGWRAFDTSGSNTVELVNDPNEATDGTNYIQITSVATGNFGDTGLDVRSADAGECMVTTGNTYRVSFDAKWVSGTGNQLIFYVKTVTEGTSTTLEASLVNESFALNTDWTSYSYEFTPTLQPTNGVSGSAFYAAFRPKIGGTLQNEVIRLDNVRLLNLTTGSYVGWMSSFPAAGVSTNYMDDPDGDGMNNLLEYALGGEPVTADASSVQPSSVVENGWMYYVYKQRKNHETVGLAYEVLSGAELADLTGATTLIGSGEYDSDFNLVTNGIPTDGPRGFMRLSVEKTD